MLITMTEIKEINKAVAIIKKQGFKLLSIKPRGKSLTKYIAYADYGNSGDEVSMLHIDTIQETYTVMKQHKEVLFYRWHSLRVSLDKATQTENTQ